MIKKRQYRLPTLLGFLILLAGLASGVYLVENFSSLWGRAQVGGIIPQDVRVSKIGDSSFAVSWLTAEATTGLIKYKVNGEEQTVYDIRDQERIAKPYKTHYLEISNLKAEARIDYEIISGGKIFPQETISLGPSLIEMPQVLPIYGRIKSPTGSAIRGVLIYVSLENASLWSSFLEQTESWVIPLAAVRTKNLEAYYCQRNSCQEETKVRLEFYSPEGKSEVITTLGLARPFLKEIVLGKNYNTLTSLDEEVKGETVSLSQKKEWKVEVLSPKEGEGLPFEKPLIRGLGVPGEEVLITLESVKKQSGKVKVKSDGTWSWAPTDPLSFGKHKLTIVTRNQEGDKVTLKHNFLVFKSGEQVLAGATPSATLTPTTPPTATPSPLPTFTPAPSPPTPTPTLPPSGFFLPSLLLLVSGFSLLFLGLTIL